MLREEEIQIKETSVILAPIWLTYLVNMSPGSISKLPEPNDTGISATFRVTTT